MNSWVLLLLAALSATRLRLGRAEGDPLPTSLVELIRTSPISSVADLKQLLQQETDSVDDEEDEHDIPTNNNIHGRYTRSLVEAQPAQQAMCKVRTEVLEVTRAMLDRRNANFLLWPPCVEVQRCSGCCNTRLLQCVPTVTATRYLQVIKIQYINRNAHYDKAIISVEDHTGCRCQALSPGSSSSSSSAANPRSPNPLPAVPQQPPAPRHTAPKAHASKADLHRHDDLKHNQQRYRPEERQAGQWQQGRYSPLAHTQPQPHWKQELVPTHGLSHAQAGVQTPTLALSGTHAQQPGRWSEGRADQGTDKRVPQTPREGGHGSGSEGAREEGVAHTAHITGEVHHPDHTQRQQQLLQYQQQQQQQQQQQHHHQQQQHHQYHHQQQPYQQPYQQNNHGPSFEDQEMRTQYRLNAPQSDGASLPMNQTQASNHKPEHDSDRPEPANQTDSAQAAAENGREQHKVTNNGEQTEAEAAGAVRESESDQSGSATSGVTATEPPAHRRDRDSEPTNGEGSLTEEDRRQKLLEILQREPERQAPPPHPHSSHRHPQHRPETTTHPAVVPTVAPGTPSAPRAPFRPALPRRRRKHRGRGRISKAAIRAMIM